MHTYTILANFAKCPYSFVDIRPNRMMRCSGLVACSPAGELAGERELETCRVTAWDTAPAIDPELVQPASPQTGN